MTIRDSVINSRDGVGLDCGDSAAAAGLGKGKRRSCVADASTRKLKGPFPRANRRRVGLKWREEPGGRCSSLPILPSFHPLILLSSSFASSSLRLKTLIPNSSHRGQSSSLASNVERDSQGRTVRWKTAAGVADWGG